MEQASSPPTSLNFPSVVVFAIISLLAIRYFFFSSPGATSTTSSSSSSLRRTVPADRVEQVAAMFPQLSRRDIEWDLLRNGSSVQATTERVLREGRLPAAPPNFRPSSPTSNTSPISVNAPSGNASAQNKPAHPDLITRYNLTSRVSATTEEEQEQIKGRQAWSQSKNEREALLKKRREEMVLQARRRMEARDAGAAGKGKGKSPA